MREHDEHVPCSWLRFVHLSDGRDMLENFKHGLGNDRNGIGKPVGGENQRRELSR